MDDGTEGFKEETRLDRLETQAEIGFALLALVELELNQKKIVEEEFNIEMNMRKLTESTKRDEIGKPSRTDQIGGLAYQAANLRENGTKLYKEGLLKAVELNKLIADYLPTGLPEGLKIKVRMERE